MVYLLFLLPGELNNAKTFFRRNATFKNLALLAILVVIIAASFVYIRHGAGEIAYPSQTRDTSGRNSLYTFLTYGGSIGVEKYNEVFERYGKSMDINLYAGFLLVPLVLLALFHGRRKLSFVVGGVCLVVFLFSIRTFVSVFFYYLYPLGNVFRHIGLTATVFKMLIIFYAGFGFEVFLERLEADRRIHYIILLYLISVMVLIKPYLFGLNRDYFWHISEVEGNLLTILIYFSLAVTIVLFGLFLKGRVKKALFLNLLLVMITVDLLSYKYSLIVTRMPSVNKKVAGLFKPYSYTFPEERIKPDSTDSERRRLFNSVGFEGTKYNTIDLFLFSDLDSSQYRTDFILKPVKKYATVVTPGTVVHEKYSGVNYPKLAVFSALNMAEDVPAMERIFNMKGFTGDMLWTTEGDIRDIRRSLRPHLVRLQKEPDFKNQDERLGADIRVEKFSFNTLKLSVAVEGPSGEHCFLYYSDAYHPHWNAYVNGRKAPVIKSNIGYKSVMIPYGRSEVVFKFGNMVYTISIFSSLLICSIILCLTVYIFVKELCLGRGREINV